MPVFPPLVLSPGSKVYKAMKSGKIYLEDPCDFSPRTYDQQKWLSSDEKASSSDTVIMFGDANFRLDPRLEDWREAEVDTTSPDIALKISAFPSDPDRDNSLVAEQRIYATLVTDALLHARTPHLMAYIGSFNCSYDEAVKLAPRLKVLEPHFHGAAKRKLTVTLLERGHGLPLQKMTRHLNEQSWLSVIFQTLWTVTVIGAMGGRHNDLHLGNVFVETDNPMMTCNYFFTKKKYFRIPVPSGLFVKVFDWDFGHAPHVNNTKIKGPMCQEYGTCATVNPKYDTFIFLWNLMNHRSFPNTLTAKLEECCVDKRLVSDFNRGDPTLNGRLCYRTHKGCDGEWTPPNDRLASPLDILLALCKDYIHDIGDIDDELGKVSYDEWFKYTYFHPNIDTKRKKNSPGTRQTTKIPKMKSG